MIHYMGIICFICFSLHTNDHELPTNLSKNFFLLFVSALALFLASQNAKNGFSIFFLSEVLIAIRQTKMGYNK